MINEVIIGGLLFIVFAECLFGTCLLLARDQPISSFKPASIPVEIPVCKKQLKSHCKYCKRKKQASQQQCFIYYPQLEKNTSKKKKKTNCSEASYAYCHIEPNILCNIEKIRQRHKNCKVIKCDNCKKYISCQT